MRSELSALVHLDAAGERAFSRWMQELDAAAEDLTEDIGDTHAYNQRVVMNEWGAPETFLGTFFWPKGVHGGAITATLGRLCLR